MLRLVRLLKEQIVFLAGLAIVLGGLSFIYRGALFQGKILFPSNLLVTYYSPWSTTTFKGWGQGVPNKPIGGNDQVRLFYPGRTVTNESWKSGEFPLWNPYIFSGSPHLANFQSAVFYPLNFFYFLLPQIKAWSILTVFPLILGFIFMYIYLRSLDCRKSASLVGAIAFGFCGFLAAWTQENAAVGQAALWLPLMLYGIEKMMDSLKFRYVLVLVFAMSSSFLGGFYQVTFYAWSVVLAYGVFLILYRKNNAFKKTVYFALSFILSLSVCAIQLIPSAEAFFDSPRGFTSVWYLFELYLLPITHLIRLIFPDLNGNPGAYNYFGKGFYHETLIYVGLVPLLFTLFAGIKLIRKPKAAFFTGIAVVSAFLTIKSPFTLWFFKLPLPLFNTFLPSRIFYITSFSLCVLSGFGVNEYLRRSGKKGEKPGLDFVFPLLGLLMITPFAYILFPLFQKGPLAEISSLIFTYAKTHPLSNSERTIMFKNILLPIGLLAAAFILTRFKRKTKFVASGLVLLTAISQFYFLNKYSVVGYPQFLYPQHFIFSFLSSKVTEGDLSRFLAMGRPIPGNVFVDKHIYSPEGLDAVFPYRYAQIVEASKNGGRIIKDVPRIEATLSETSDSESMLKNKRRLRLVSVLGVKYFFYYLEKPLTEMDLLKKFPEKEFKPLWQKENWYAYENLGVLPRTFLSGNYIFENNPQSIADKFFADDFDPLRTVILEEPVKEEIKENTSDKERSRAVISQYKPEFVEIKTDSENQKILFLSDNYNPGWNAFVDGKKTKIYRADFTFRAVVVPPGKHTVTFSYSPVTFKAGLAVTAGSLFIIFLSPIGFFIFKLSRRKK